MAIPYVIPSELPPVQLTPTISVPDGFIRDPKDPRLITTLSDCLYNLRLNNYVRDEFNGTWMRKYDEYKLPTGGYTRCIHIDTNGKWTEELDCDEEAVKAWMASAPGPKPVTDPAPVSPSLADILQAAIADGAVTSQSIADGAVTDAHISDDDEDELDLQWEPDYEY